MSSKELLNLAIGLINSGKPENARTAIRQALDSDPDDMTAWALLVQVANGPDEEMSAIREVLRLNPDDDWAQKYLTNLVDKEAMKRVVDLINLDRKDQASFLLDQIITRSPNNPEAWVLKARLAKKRADAISALEQVVRLNPEDDRAHEYLNRLIKEQREIEQARLEKAQREKEREEEEKEKKKTGVVRSSEKKKIKISSDIIYGLLGIILLLTLVCFVLGYPLLPEDQRFLGDLWLKSESDVALSKYVEGSCEALINKALEVSDTGCRKIGRNEICYGNYDITANVNEGFLDQFSFVGDVIPINGVKQLYASPLDLAKNLWGVAVLKLQANMPGTVPGQNVTFLVFGDTSVENTSGDMSAFYFSTGFSGVKCSEVPFDGLLIEMPDGSGMSFNANGVDFLLQGDAILQARPGDAMTISMIDGTGMIRADGQIQALGPGTYATVPLGDDLNPTGPPSESSDLPEEDGLLGCYLLGVGCPPDVEGPIRAATSTPDGDSGQPTFTPVPIDPNIPTNTPVPVDPNQPTNTPVPVPSGQPTNTSVPLPTNTSAPLPTNTPPPAPTNTSPPGATNTPVPTATNTPVPTNTTAPPTATNTPISGACSDISVNAGGSPGEFSISSTYATDIIITEITLNWPVITNGQWRQSWLADKNIHSENFSTSPATSVLFADTGKRTITNSGISDQLRFTFQNAPAPTGYNVTITFDVGCPKSASQQ